MNELLLIGIIALGTVPFAIWVLKWIFGKSIMYIISLWTALFSIFCCFLYFIIGRMGVINTLWATPLSFSIGAMMFVYIKRSSIQQLNSITQINASSSEELSESAESLANRAQHLNELISYFKISGSQGK